MMKETALFFWVITFTHWDYQWRAIRLIAHSKAILDDQISLVKGKKGKSIFYSGQS